MYINTLTDLDTKVKGYKPAGDKDRYPIIKSLFSRSLNVPGHRRHKIVKNGCRPMVEAFDPLRYSLPVRHVGHIAAFDSIAKLALVCSGYLVDGHIAMAKNSAADQRTIFKINLKIFLV
jgi:hypothetical protein